MNRTTINIDADTGEILEYRTVIVPKRHAYLFNQFGVFNMEAMKEISKIKSAEQLRVLFRLLAELDYDNNILIHQAVIAKEMGLLPQAFSRAVAGLVKRGILIRGPERSLRLNPAYGYRGSAKSHGRAIDEARARGLDLSIIDGGKTQ